MRGTLFLNLFCFSFCNFSLPILHFYSLCSTLQLIPVTLYPAPGFQLSRQLCTFMPFWDLILSQNIKLSFHFWKLAQKSKISGGKNQLAKLESYFPQQAGSWKKLCTFQLAGLTSLKSRKVYQVNGTGNLHLKI